MDKHYDISESDASVLHALEQLFKLPYEHNGLPKLEIVSGEKTCIAIFQRNKEPVKYNTTIGYKFELGGKPYSTTTREVFCTNAAFEIDNYATTAKSIDLLLARFEELVGEQLVICVAGTGSKIGWVATDHWLVCFVTLEDSL